MLTVKSKPTEYCVPCAIQGTGSEIRARAIKSVYSIHASAKHTQSRYPWLYIDPTGRVHFEEVLATPALMDAVVLLIATGLVT
jgi:hypothetical protein